MLHAKHVSSTFGNSYVVCLPWDHIHTQHTCPYLHFSMRESEIQLLWLAQTFSQKQSYNLLSYFPHPSSSPGTPAAAPSSSHSTSYLATYSATHSTLSSSSTTPCSCTRYSAAQCFRACSLAHRLCDRCCSRRYRQLARTCYMRLQTLCASERRWSCGCSSRLGLRGL